MKKSKGAIILSGLICLTFLIGCGNGDSEDASIDVASMSQADRQTIPAETEDTFGYNEAELAQAMDRVLSLNGLESALTIDEYIDKANQAEGEIDAVVLLGSSEHGKYEIYGVSSKEFGSAGMVINCIIDGKDNWKYLHELWSWRAGLQVHETDDHEFSFSYCDGYGTGVHMEQFYVCRVYDTGTVALHKLSNDAMWEALAACSELVTDTAKQTVQVWQKENGARPTLLAEIPYAAYADETGEGYTIETAQLAEMFYEFQYTSQGAVLNIGIELTGENLPPTILYLDESVSYEMKWSYIENDDVIFRLENPKVVKTD
ncbi:MAG: hypothetical protein IJ794_19390 [Lachnospiraceae bacterium]|nr:hypothetical protein [Lachnospiraceae bacterium]